MSGHAFKVLRCEVGGRSFAIDVTLIQGIEHPRGWARLPGAPGFVSGVIEMRDQVVVVIDLAARLGLLPEARTPERPVVLVESEEPVGVAVDAVSGVCVIDPDALAVPAGSLGAAVQGVGADALVLLDAEAVVDGRPLRPLTSVVPEDGGGGYPAPVGRDS